MKEAEVFLSLEAEEAKEDAEMQLNLTRLIADLEFKESSSCVNKLSLVTHGIRILQTFYNGEESLDP